MTEITDEVEWHDILTNPVMYIEDAGLVGVRWTFIAHVALFEKPNEGVDNEYLYDGEFETRFIACDKCFKQTVDYLAKEMLDKAFGETDGPEK